MMHRILAAVVLLFVAWPASPAQAGDVYFDDSSQPGLIIIGNASHYEIGLLKTNGAIAYIRDKRVGGTITRGSRYECLWGASLDDTHPFVGGCHYNPAGPNRFSYDWSQSTETLTFTYMPDPNAAEQVWAQVTIKPSAGAWLDMGLQLRNERGLPRDWILFPCDLVFTEAEIHQALLPILPGVMLTPRFFAENRSYTAAYPGYPGVFADFAWLDTDHGKLAIYSRFDESLRPNTMGFIHDEAYLPDSTFYYHTFGARLAAGSTFTSPWVRIRVGPDAFEAVQAYRADNAMDVYPSLAGRLGPAYDRLIRSPLYKADTAQLGLKFTEYGPLLTRIPAPGILHPVAFQPGAHDEHYPDFLPPAPAWGTTAEMAAMFRQAQALGFFVMPYSNPTWWDDESPTLSNLPAPLTLEDVAAVDGAGRAITDTYGSHFGYVISPYPDFVKARLDRLVHEMTEDVPGDLLFEDQIGARPWLVDHNGSSPSPLAYIDGWLAHTRTYRDELLMTELAFDRLAETETGFHGSVLLPQVTGATAAWWGEDTWRPYPLATALARDKVLFYQHDLAPETMTSSKATLTWNLAMGYQLSYDLVSSTYGGGPDSAWLGVVSAFQKHVAAAYAGQRITGYVDETPAVTRTDYETCRAYVNWDPTENAPWGAHTLAPSGALVTCEDGRLVAGVLRRFNDLELSPGDHYLVVTHDATRVTVRQPAGEDTDLRITPLPTWGGRPPKTALALDAAGSIIGRVPVSADGAGVTFRYRGKLAGQAVSAYRLAKFSGVFQPLVAR